MFEWFGSNIVADTKDSYLWKAMWPDSREYSLLIIFNFPAGYFPYSEVTSWSTSSTFPSANCGTPFTLWNYRKLYHVPREMMCTCHSGDSATPAVPPHWSINRSRSWCWRKRRKQWEFRREKPAMSIECLFKRVDHFFILWCSGACSATFIVEGQLCGNGVKRRGEGGLSLLLLWFLLQVQDSRPATGIVPVSSQTSQSLLSPHSCSSSSSTTQSILPSERKAPS